MLLPKRLVYFMTSSLVKSALSYAFAGFLGLLLGYASLNREKLTKDESVQFVEQTVKEAREEYEEPDSLSSDKMRALEQEAQCLAENVYFESRSESLAGQLAVAFVTLNRTAYTRFKPTICGVVNQKKSDKKTGKIVCQFSWTCDGIPDVVVERKKFEEIMEWCRKVVFSEMDSFDFTNGSTHFHTRQVKPGWTDLVYVMTIDNHVFYRMKEA